MASHEIDYDALKERGFLQARGKGHVTLRTRFPAGNCTSDDLQKLGEIARKYAGGALHCTVRQGIEIPNIKLEDVDNVEKEIIASGIDVGACGPRLRAITCCPGKNWCKRGLVSTISLFERLENERGIKCGMHLPHKFKISISGCPNTCTRVQGTEFGLHGAVDVNHPEKRAGYIVYVGGCGGKTPHEGIKLSKVYTEDEGMDVIEKVVEFFKNNAKTRQRLALLIDEMGKENFLKAIGEKEAN